ncbi:hypothetical protein RJ639_009811 [Escallonia herrerae]|uniref:ATP-dependent DNA helicase n=1 Tax=Escallonia herrerae TaxID=1293975 RepID=A0AA88VTI3_9ASTE|nr:hypothetical protein RJ639_009811 [Escallonia herrerae]
MADLDKEAVVWLDDKPPTEWSRYVSPFSSNLKASTTLEDHELLYPIKFLNSLKLRGIPNYDLRIRALIMLMRNITPNKGVTTPGDPKIIIQDARQEDDGYTKNVAYKDSFNNLPMSISQRLLNSDSLRIVSYTKN